MTDRNILKKLVLGRFQKSAILNQDEKDDISSTLTQLHTYYREKIKRVGIEDIIRELDLCVELAPSDISSITQAILKAIDKEMR